MNLGDNVMIANEYYIVKLHLVAQVKCTVARAPFGDSLFPMGPVHEKYKKKNYM